MKPINTFLTILFISLLSSPSWSKALEAAANMDVLDALIERQSRDEFEQTTSYFGAQVGVIGALALSVMLLWLSKTIKTLSWHFRSKREYHIKDTVAKNVSNEDSDGVDVIATIALIALIMMGFNVLDNSALPAGKGWFLLFAETVGSVTVPAAAGAIAFLLFSKAKRRITISIAFSYVVLVIIVIGTFFRELG